MSPSSRKMPSAAPALDQLKPPVRGLILDMDGVLWRDTELIDDPAASLSALLARGLRLVLATNNATKSADDYASRLRTAGVELTTEQIVTSADATAQTLAATVPAGSSIFVVGEGGLIETLRARGFEVESDPGIDRSHAAVVAGMDRELSYAKIQRAASLVRGGAPYYGTNADATFPTPEGLIPGAGACLAAITMAAQREPMLIGKPAPLLFKMAAERMGLEAPDVLVVGDRLETDIAGGQAFGARTALVLTGVSTADQARAWSPPPTLVASSLSALVGR